MEYSSCYFKARTVVLASIPSFDLTLRGECEERERFNGTVVYSAGWFSDRFYITGNGDYTAPAVGTVSVRWQDVQYETAGCYYPIAGRMTASAGGQTGTVTFRSTCGIARINIGGVEENIDLDNIAVRRLPLIIK
jgi:hypothetical protein